MKRFWAVPKRILGSKEEAAEWRTAFESRIRELGIKLREAVEIENYEEAARLRDMIHQLKKMDNTDDSTQGGGHDA